MAGKHWSLLTRWRGRWTGSLLLFAMAVSVLTSVGQTVAVTPAAAADPLACDGTTVYVQNSSGEVRAFNSATKQLAGSSTVTGQQANGLGISNDGRMVYTINNTSSGGVDLRIHDRVSGTTSNRSTPGNTSWHYGIRGAVNPVNDIYYFTSSHTSSSPLRLGAYDPATDTVFEVGQFQRGGAGGIPATPSAGNGDLAFTSTGEMIITNDSAVYFVNQAIPTTPGNRTFTVTSRATLPGGATSNGIAFGANGNLFISTGSTIHEVNPATGGHVGSTSLSNFSTTDMASCRAFPSTLTVRKDLPDGRAKPGDQFRLSANGPNLGAGGQQATTTGSAPGVQNERVGPLFVTPNETYSIAESTVAGASFGDYTTSLACRDAANGDAPVAVNGSAPNWTIVQPVSTSTGGADVVCTITNDRIAEPAIQLVKTNDAAGAVDAGQTVTYSFAVTNLGETALTGLQLTDTVVDGATFDPSPQTLAGMVLQPSQTVTVTATYTVTEQDLLAGSVVNHAKVVGTPSDPNGQPTGQDPVEDEDTSSFAPADVDASIDLVKSGAALDGNGVGDLVTYTLTSTNDGNVTLADVTITDPMLGGDITPQDASAWESGVVGTLAPGESVTTTATYPLTQADIDLGNVFNLATTEGTPPDGGDPVEADDPEVVPTEEPAPTIRIVKTGETLDGNEVGDLVTYTLTSTNWWAIGFPDSVRCNPLRSQALSPIADVGFEWRSVADPRM